ncbi:glutamate racemase [Levilactobacillus tujiorum]|uniref:glutamate racemase n=1 Tax=Levilactobacillus tujiorum TaxID=2912243 RepID=UPI001456581C|nr:glutamate racemase [Levilactobacillus tujiorum]NLR31149.1 glutamate racemase [Levilactobacillus tujiorum]
MQNSPIGLMDSGVGGLTVLKEVQRLLPTEKTVFLGDQARLPYGPRDAAEVTTFTRQIAGFLQQQADIKMLIIACNTATAAALATMQRELTIPVVGVIAPGARSAVQATHNHRIGVIATTGTVKSDQYRTTILAKDPHNEVISLACQEFVTLVEQNDLNSEHARAVVQAGLAPLLDQDIDTLVMGCTHFPLLRPLIQDVMGAGVTLVDPGTATAKMATSLLDYWNLANPEGVRHPQSDYYTTGDIDRFNELADNWLEETPVRAQHLSLTALTHTTEVN